MTDQQAVEPATPTPRQKRWGARSIASLLLFVLATILVIPALVGHWGHRTVADAERYIDTVGPLIYQSEVQDALSEAVTKQVVARVDNENQVGQLLGNLFPDAPFTDQLAGPISAGINNLIGELVKRFVSSDQFAQFWITFNRAVQKGVMLVLEGKDGGPVFLRGDEVVLDTSAALTAIQNYLVDNGVTAAANVTIPETDREVVLFTSPALEQVRFIYSLTSPILEWLPAIVALIFGIAIMLARRRARTTVATGIVLLASGLVTKLALDATQTTFENKLIGTPWGPAADVFWTTLLSYLVDGVMAIITLGVVLIIAGWFGGRTTIAANLRGMITKGLAEIGGRLSDGRSGVIPPSMLGAARVLIFILATAILLFSSLLDVATVLWVTALAAGLVTLAQLLAGPAAGSTISIPEGVETNA
ncbi:MAG: hypothetical protein GC156_00500 [Actinomycetales bacterium]|nr:hypothetical protein [Actinomycetales bacterium]